MKTILWLFTAVIFITGCNSQTNSLDEKNLKGKVWKIQETSYEGVEKSGKYELGKKNYSGNYQYIFNEKGNVIEYLDLYRDGDIDDIVKYIYNEDDICLEIIAFDDREEDEILWKEVNIIEGDRIIGVENYDDEGEVTRRRKYYYKGNFITGGEGEVIDEKYGSKYSFEIEYIKGFMSSQTFRDDLGETSQITTYNRNDNHDIMLSTTLNPNDSSETKFTFEYEYDDKGNWIKQYQFNEESIIEGIIVRKIDYYDKSKKVKSGGEFEGIWFVIETDDDWFDEDDWLVIEAENKFDIGYDEEVWKSGLWERDKKQNLFTLRSEDDSKKYKYDIIDAQLILYTINGEEIVRFEKR